MEPIFDRLTRLSRQTGDRIILHDSATGESTVLLNLDEYERLISDKKDVRELSSEQLLDQINRDIAIWRANQQMDEEEEHFSFLGTDTDSSESLSKSTQWHQAGNILEGRFGLPRQITAVEEIPVGVPIIAEESVENIAPTEVEYREVEQPETQAEPLSDEEPVFFEEPV